MDGNRGDLLQEFLVIEGSPAGIGTVLAADMAVVAVHEPGRLPTAGRQRIEAAEKGSGQ